MSSSVEPDLDLEYKRLSYNLSYHQSSVRWRGFILAHMSSTSLPTVFPCMLELYLPLLPFLTGDVCTLRPSPTARFVMPKRLLMKLTLPRLSSAAWYARSSVSADNCATDTSA